MFIRKKSVVVILSFAVIAVVSVFNLFRVNEQESSVSPEARDGNDYNRPALVSEEVGGENEQTQMTSHDLVSVPLDDPDVKETIRTEYRNSPDLPDGIAFALTLAAIGMPGQIDGDSHSDG